MDRCEECGFVYDLSEALEAGPAVVAHAGDFRDVLGSPAADLRTRRKPDTWSPLEYACHVRDVLLVQRERVLAARRFDRPTCEPMGRDERVDHDGYAEQDPGDVARQLGDAAALFANVLARLGPDDWDREVVYTYPEPADRPVRWVAVHTVHELRHRLLDVDRQLDLRA
jgi:DinB superfamily